MCYFICVSGFQVSLYSFVFLFVVNLTFWLLTMQLFSNKIVWFSRRSTTTTGGSAVWSKKAATSASSPPRSSWRTCDCSRCRRGPRSYTRAKPARVRTSALPPVTMFPEVALLPRPVCLVLSEKITVRDFFFFDRQNILVLSCDIFFFFNWIGVDFRGNFLFWCFRNKWFVHFEN